MYHGHLTLGHSFGHEKTTDLAWSSGHVAQAQAIPRWSGFLLHREFGPHAYFLPLPLYYLYIRMLSLLKSAISRWTSFLLSNQILNNVGNV